MSRRNLDEFIGQIAHIRAVFVPSTLMTADGAGGKSSAQELVYELNKLVASLKNECLIERSNEKTIERLKRNIEGVLLGLNTMNVIDKSTLGALLGKLYLI